MTANIHAVPAVANGPRKASDFLAGLDQNGFDCRISLQLDGRSQAGRTCSDEDRSALLFGIAWILRHTFFVAATQNWANRDGGLAPEQPSADMVSAAN
jgi:hypothetical protein